MPVPGASTLFESIVPCIGEVPCVGDDGALLVRSKIVLGVGDRWRGRLEYIKDGAGLYSGSESALFRRGIVKREKNQ